MNTNIEELASLYVLDKLNQKERLAFEERLETDTELLLFVRELESGLEEQIRSLPQHQVPVHVWPEIRQRIRSEPTLPSTPVITLPWSTFAGWGMVAALLLGVGLTLLFTSRETVKSPLYPQPVLLVVGLNPESSVSEVIPTMMPFDEQENFVHLAQMAETYWKHPERLPETAGQSPLANTLSRGYAVFDPQSKHGFIAIQKLPVQKKGKNYLLWLRDSQSNVLACAGIIPMQEKDQGLYFFELNDNSPISSNRVAFFITEEDASEKEPSQPKGHLVLGSDHI